MSVLFSFLQILQPVDYNNPVMEGYDDILAPRRKGLDISFALEKKDDTPEYKYVNHQLPKQFKENVLKSQRLRHTIDQVGILSHLFILIGGEARGNPLLQNRPREQTKPSSFAKYRSQLKGK